MVEHHGPKKSELHSSVWVGCDELNRLPFRHEDWVY